MNIAHVMPDNDLVQHTEDDTCACGPEVLPVQRPDGSFGWVYSHHALDGRE